jgi:hypothetical protein
MDTYMSPRMNTVLGEEPSPLLAALLDEKAIIDLTVAYCWALDSRRFEDLRAVFVQKATANLAGTESDGIEAIIQRCSAALTPLDVSQHMVSTHQIEIKRDIATCRCYLQAQHVKRGTEGGSNFILAGRYEDELIRTPVGWRITRRTLVTMWTAGNPAVIGRRPG